MTQSINELEREIEESRARLDLTLDRIQDKMSVSGVVDDMLGSMRRNQYAETFDAAISVIRRNPVPVMLIAAGVGWLIHRAGKAPVRGTAIMPYEGHPAPLLTPVPVQPAQAGLTTPPVTGSPLDGSRRIDGRI